MQNRVNLAIAESNQAYANSGIDLVLNLVHLEEDTSGYDIDRVDQSSISPSLTALRSSTDGNLDYIHQLRMDVGADMVALITAGAGCGIANLCGNSPTAMPSANCVFSVTRWDCATGKWLFLEICYCCYVVVMLISYITASFHLTNNNRILLILPRTRT